MMKINSTSTKASYKHRENFSGLQFLCMCMYLKNPCLGGCRIQYHQEVGESHQVLHIMGPFQGQKCIYKEEVKSTNALGLILSGGHCTTIFMKDSDTSQNMIIQICYIQT
jgi:hypothetical protein